MPQFPEGSDLSAVQYYDEDHSPSGNPSDEMLSAFITILSLGAILGGGVYNLGGGTVTAAVEGIISIDEASLAVENAILTAGARAVVGDIALTAEEQALADVYMERMMSQGVQTAGTIFFPSGM